MKHRPIWPFFLLALFWFLCCQSLIPSLHLFSFAPFLAITYSRYPLTPSLWIAAGVGLMIDAVSSTLPFGLHALNYSLLTLYLHRYRHYFVDKPIGLASFTTTFSLTSTALQWGLSHLFGISLPLSAQGIATDFFLMPLVDGVYAFIWFSCPTMLYHTLKKQWRSFLLFRKEKGKEEKGKEKKAQS